MKERLLRIVTAPEAITLLLLVVALGMGHSLSPNFLDASYLLDKTSMLVPIGLMAVAMTFVIAAGQIDLSVASNAVLCMVIGARLYEAGVPMGWVMPLTLLTGALLGLLNGIGVVLLRLPALVFTLGTLALYRGIAQVLIEERTIKGFPKWFLGIDYTKYTLPNLAGPATQPVKAVGRAIRSTGIEVPAPFIGLLVVVIVATVVMTMTTFGRRVLAIGTNEQAARYSAVRTDRLKMIVFTLSGLSAGAAALVMMSMLRSVDHKQFRGGELLAITAVVLGGTSIFGGRATVPGTFIAMMLLVVVQSAMSLARWQAETRLLVVGALLIGAVLLLEALRRLAERLIRASGAKKNTLAGGTDA
ncbi:MAG: ABC transporter permease [Tepidisphaeraceae bacterium]